MSAAALTVNDLYQPGGTAFDLWHEVRAVDRIRVNYDRTGNTLTFWFDDPKNEHVCEEIGDDMVLMKDREGRVVG
jgi:Protein of unknown function (DUF2283)